MQPAGGIQAAHGGVYQRETGLPLLPARQNVLAARPFYPAVFGAEGFGGGFGTVEHDLSEKIAADKIVQPLRRTPFCRGLRQFARREAAGGKIGTDPARAFFGGESAHERIVADVGGKPRPLPPPRRLAALLPPFLRCGFGQCRKRRQDSEGRLKTDGQAFRRPPVCKTLRKSPQPRLPVRRKFKIRPAVFVHYLRSGKHRAVVDALKRAALRVQHPPNPVVARGFVGHTAFVGHHRRRVQLCGKPRNIGFGLLRDKQRNAPFRQRTVQFCRRIPQKRRLPRVGRIRRKHARHRQPAPHGGG